MPKQQFQFARGRFVNPARIISSHIYQKDEVDQTGQATGRKVIRVAMELDTLDKAKSSVFSDAFENVQQAEAYIQTIPCE